MRDAEQGLESWYFTARVSRMKVKKIKVIVALLVVAAVPTGLIAILNYTPDVALPRDVVKYLYLASAGLFLLVPIVLVIFLMTMAMAKQTTFCVSGGRLVVDRGAHNEFLLAGAEMGAYCTPNGTARGSALHLRNDHRDFVVGTNDVRMASSRRLEAPPVSRLDAYVASTDFATLLGMVGSGYVPASRTSAAPTKFRCLLFPHIGRLSYAFTGIRRMGKPPQASRAIEVDGDLVSVIDARTNVRLASAPRSQVTVKPARWQPISIPTYVRIPILVVRMPGVRPLSVGLPDARVGWGERVPRRLSPRYVASAWEWLKLAEIFGLTSALAEGVPSLADLGEQAM